MSKLKRAATKGWKSLGYEIVDKSRPEADEKFWKHIARALELAEDTLAYIQRTFNTRGKSKNSLGRLDCYISNRVDIWGVRKIGEKSTKS